MRGTGGNRFIPAGATRADLMRSINDQLGDLQEWADDTGRSFDLAEVTIYTERIPGGLISVSVEADLGPATPPGTTCQVKDFSGETWCQREVVAGRDYCWSHLPAIPPGVATGGDPS